MKPQVILIAGASSGMGRALALKLAAEGHRLVLFARREQELTELADDIRAIGGESLTIVGDAQLPADAERCVTQALQHFGHIDTALINVGAGPEQRMADCSVADIRATFDLNYLTLVNFLPPLIRVMRARGQGLIAHTNSLAGFLGLPLQGPYSAAKGAARLLMDSCRVELAGEGLRFMSVYPGFVRTARVDGYDMAAPFSISEEKGAHYLFKALHSRRNDVLFPGPLSLLIHIARILPKGLTTRLLRRAM
ncbi:SDR family NAD(P)-dependent oxidoreductase [Thalassolituus sp. LLYu03]|uniref:SDR family NAD(P)-dependent oxidoreductase n=1 Tax=Thalassolituus sp. LLYu03 TaxID=3421656 RepID=UPI003D2DFD87